MSVGTWLLAVLIMELVAIVCVAYLAFGGFFKGMRPLAKIGIFLITTGLMVQIMRTLHFFEFGAYPVDTFFPLWVTKDIGGSLLIFDLFLAYVQRKFTKQANTEQAQA
jgi:hypothetical protein